MSNKYSVKIEEENNNKRLLKKKIQNLQLKEIKEIRTLDCSAIYLMSCP